MLTQKEQQGSTIAIRENQLFGDWLMQQGCIGHEQLDAALADQKKKRRAHRTIVGSSEAFVRW